MGVWLLVDAPNMHKMSGLSFARHMHGGCYHVDDLTDDLVT